MKVFLDSVGCRLNQSEIEHLARQFLQAGHSLVDDVDDADLVIINTCAVTTKAASDSRGKLRQAVRKNPDVKLISTGCWATLEPEQAAQMDNVFKVVLNSEKDNLVAKLLDRPENQWRPDFWPRLPGSHAHMRAFIKVQDGCNNFCTFCVTRLVRGKSVSLPAARILTEIQSAAHNGVLEVVLSGVNLGAWGRDLASQGSLTSLIKMILNETDIPRIRLSSLEPWDVDERFFEPWENPRMCRHLHLPLQSGADAILKRMGRRITTKRFLEVVQKAQAMIPDVAITTDVIVGFPGEDDTAFQQSLAYIKELGFSAGHIFSYSPRPGTAAINLDGQVPSWQKKERSRQLRALFQQSGKAFRQAQLGKSFPVLWETGEEISPGRWRLSGLTDTYLRVTRLSTQNGTPRMESVRVDVLERGILASETIPSW
jgi:threonylcarbamoyladenosine tRNA methylthiotransferase MtaB